MSNGKATGPDGIPAEILKLGHNGEASDILYHFHDIVSAVWASGEVPQEWKDIIIKVLHKKQGRKDPVYSPRNRKIVANRLGDLYEETDAFPQCGFRGQRLTTDMMFVVHPLQELGRASNIPIKHVFNRSAENQRFCRPHAPVGSACSVRSPVANDHDHPYVSRRHASSSTSR
ncbi:unnamed protein product [Sphacelaria rigidula]